MARIKANT